MTTEATRSRMRSQPTRDTQPELALRRRLHAAGLRYRVDHPLPTNRRRRADVLHTPSRVAVFVDGCFWHGCPEHSRPIRTDTGFWNTKIERNRQRDLDTDETLRAHGWLPIRVWEHDDPDGAARRVLRAVARRRR